MKSASTAQLPRGVQPYLFAYDIRCSKRRRLVLQALRRWRVDGQYSVHETLLHPAQVRDLSVELLGLVERDEDSLLVGRLNQRGDGPVYQWHPPKQVTAPLFGAHLPRPIPRHLHGGNYLLAYDVRCPLRLQRVQRVVAKQALFLQRSVYLYQGGGRMLLDLVHTGARELERGEDDLRLYSITSGRDLWFLSGATPPLAGAAAHQQEGFWRRLVQWLFGKDGRSR